MGAVAQTQQVNQEERRQLQELRAEALKLADWIADNRATGHSNLEINEKKLAELLTKNESLLKKDPNFNNTLLRDIERAKSPESRILAEATKLAQWVSHDRAQNKLEQAAYNEKQLGALLERHADFFAANPLAAKRIATAVEKARNSVSKEKTVSATTGSAALSEEVEKQAHALSEELGYAQAKGDKQSATKLQEQLKQLQQQHNTSITSYGSSLFESELATSRQAGMQRWLTAEKDAATIQNALHLVGSDKQTIYAILQQKQGESTEAYNTRLDALKEAHQSSYGRSLEGDLRYYLQGASEERAAALLRGDKVGARLFQLIEARGALSDDLRSIQEAYQGLSAAEIAELNNRIEAYWQKEYGVSYNKKLASSTGLSTHEYRSIEAARRGDELGVVTHNLRVAQDALIGREEAVNGILEENRHQMAALRGDYAKKIYNTTETDNHLEKDLKKNLDAGDQQNRAVANARGEFVAADAYRLRDAVKSGDQTEVDAVLQGKTKSERAALEATYNKLPGGNTLRHDIQALGAEEAANTTTLLDSAADRPELSREALFRRAVTGWNVDEAGMVAALQGMSKAEAWAFRQSYQRAHGVDPWALVERHLSGDDLYAARESLLGAPENREEAIRRAEARAKYERSGLLSGVVDAFSNGQGAHLDRTLAELRSETNTELIALRWEQHQAAAKGYSDAKNSVAETAANTAAMVAAGAATALTGGAAAPVLLIAIGGSAFGATAVTKYLLKGSGYGSDEQLIDLGKSAAEGLAFGAGSRFARWGISQFSRGIERRVLEEALEEIGEGGLSGALNGAVDGDWSNPRGALQGVLYGSVLGAVTGGAGGAAGARVPQWMLRGVEREIETVTTRVIESYVRKVATEGLSEAAQQQALQAATRQIVRETAAIQNRLSTKLGLTMVSAASGGLTSGALNGLTALPSGMSFEESVAFLLLAATRDSGVTSLGGVAGGVAQRRPREATSSLEVPTLINERLSPRTTVNLLATPSPSDLNQDNPSLGRLTLPAAPIGVPTQQQNIIAFPANRRSNDGTVEYLSPANFHNRYVQQRIQEGLTPQQAEAEANRTGAYYDTETKTIVLRDHEGKLTLEEAIRIGALISHERAHQQRGASELEAFRAMESYLHRNGYELRYDSILNRLFYAKAERPSLLSDETLNTLLAMNYQDEGSLRLAASVDMELDNKTLPPLQWGALKSQVDFVIAEEIVKEGIFPSEHEFTQYAQNIFQRLLSGADITANEQFNPRLIILDTAELRAEAYPDGTIIISPQLLLSVDTEDEFAAVLAHELIHGRDRHYVERHTRADTTSKSIALLRIHETEADILASTQILSKSGYNPYAMSSALANIENAVGSEATWDLEHGTTLDRRLHIFTVGGLLDLAGSGGVQSPIPEQLKTAIQQHTRTPNQLSLLHKLDRSQLAKLYNSLQDSLNPESLNLAGNVLSTWYGTILSSLKKHKEWYNETIKKQGQSQLGRSATHPNNFTAKEYVTELSQLFDALDSSLAQSIPDQEQRALALALLLDSEFDIPLFGKTEINDNSYSNLNLVDFRTNDNRWFGTEHIAGTLLQHGFDPLIQLFNGKTLDEAQLTALIFESDGLKRLIQYADEVVDIFIDGDTEEASPSFFLQQASALLAAHESFSKLRALPTDTPSTILLQVFNQFIKRRRIRPNDTINSFDLDNSLQRATLILLANEHKIDLTGFSLSPVEQALAELWRPPQHNDKLVKLGVTRLLLEQPESQIKNLVEAYELLPKDASERFNELLVTDLDNLIQDKKREDSLFAEIELLCKKLIENNHPTSGPVLKILIESDFIHRLGSNSVTSELLLETTKKYFALVNSLETSTKKKFSDADETLFTLLTESLKIIDRRSEKFSFLEQCLSLHSTNFIDATYKNDTPNILDILAHQEIIADLTGEQNPSPQELLTISNLFGNKDLRENLRSNAINRLFETLPFNQAKKILIDEGRSKFPEYRFAFERLAETLAQTRDQLSAVWRGGLQNARQSTEENGGTFVVADGFLDSLVNTETLKIALQTSEDEHNLVTAVVKKWWGIHSLFYKDHYDPTYLDKTSDTCWQKAVSEWIEEDARSNAEEFPYRELALRPDEFLFTPETTINRLYELSPSERYLLVRKLLASELGDAKKTAGLFDQFLNDHVEIPGDKKPELLDNLVSSFITHSSIEERYFLLRKLIEDAVFNQPAQGTDRRAVVREVLRDAGMFGYSGEPNEFSYEDEPEGEDMPHRPLDEDALPYKVNDRPGLNTYLQLIVEKAYRQAFPIEHSGENKKHDVFWAERALATQYSKGAIENGRQGKLKPIDAILHAAAQLRAPGVRGLQLVTQFLQVDAETRKGMLGIYDDMKGQTKLAAFQTIDREAPHILQGNDRLTERLGGGSLMTVFRLLKEDGTKRVVKVLNPNSEYYVNEVLDLAKRTVGAMVDKDPHNKELLLVRNGLLPDLKEWLLSDINDTRFPELDKQFRKNWNGWKGSRKSKFSMFVPESEDLQTKFVKIENEVDGKTLTKFTIGNTSDYEKGTLTKEDMEAIVELIERNYTEQIKKGVVHSNPTLGNFMITRDMSQVAIIDRNYFLELDKDDRAMLTKMELARLLPLGNPIKPMMARLFKLDENRSLDGKKSAIENAILEQFSGRLLNSAADVTDLLLALRQQDVKIPLRMTLLAINLNALESMRRDLIPPQ